jgi:hypothetical protein
MDITNVSNVSTSDASIATEDNSESKGSVSAMEKSTEGVNPIAEDSAEKRSMSHKGFLHKCKSKAAVAAGAFIAAHRDWITSGELGAMTAPILMKLDNKELLPTPALQEIQNAVLNHMLIVNQRSTEEAIGKEPTAGGFGRKAEPKAHQAMIVNSKGEVQVRIKENGEDEDLIKEFDMPQDGVRWIDRRLVECSSDCYAIFSHNRTHQEEIITRDDAMSRVFAKAKQPTMKPQTKTTSKLSFGVKAKQSHAKFSHG